MAGLTMRLLDESKRAACVIALAACTALAAGTHASAQTAAPRQAAAADAAPAGAEAGLKSRVESLEEQLVDMQVVVGTLESMSKQGGAAAAPAFAASGGGGADQARISSLEAQVRSLTADVQQLSDQVRNLGGTPEQRSALPPVSQSVNQPAGQPPVAVAGGGFGDTTVTHANDPIGGLIDNRAPQPAPLPPGNAMSAPPAGDTFGGQPPPVQTAALPAAGDGSNPKQQYETAYGYLLQRDYGAAEVAFDDFLKKYPSDSLAGNAQYWLGESHFVRGQYKAAASAFLKGYQTYGQSTKAPDSLLKLAMSLDKLGQKDAACASYSELSTKFPNAPQNVVARAKAERTRVGCP